MQITATAVKRDNIPADDRYQIFTATFLLNDTGVVLKDCRCVWDTGSGASVVTIPEGISFFNVFFQSAFASLAMQAALLFLAQQPGTLAKVDSKVTFPLQGYVN